jgi:tetratricopeptide (TPR) repeat protein
MFGRLLRILVGLAVLAAAIDIWRPSLIPQGYGIPVRFGDFEDLRQTAVIALGVVGAAFVIAGLVGSGRKRRVSRSAPNSTFALAFDPELEEKLAPAPTTLVAAPASLVRPAEPAAPAADASPAPPIEPAPLEQTSTAAWIPAAMPVLANAPLAAASIPTAPQPAAHPAPAPSGSGRAAFVSATESGDRLRLDGQPDEAMEHYSRALDLARTGLNSAPSDVQAHADIAAALANLGDAHDAQGQLEPALAAYEESLTFHRALAAHAPNDRAAQRGLSHSLEKLADTREARGHRSRALDLYRESLPIAEKLAADHPGDVLLTQDLATTKERLASLRAQMT